MSGPLQACYSTDSACFLVLFFSACAGAGSVLFVILLFFGRRFPNVPRQIFPRRDR
jgi:hypothetical protein